MHAHVVVIFFFFNDTATTEIYTLSLHDALPTSPGRTGRPSTGRRGPGDRIFEGRKVCVMQNAETVLDVLRDRGRRGLPLNEDRKSTRLNSSHGYISYAVFCLKKKKKR